MVKKLTGTVRHAIKDYWMHMVRYNHHNMSRGAENINKIITWARKDNWRRKDHKK